MNAQQSKTLIAVARKAAEVLRTRPLTTAESNAVYAVEAILRQIEATKATAHGFSASKCVFCEEAGAELDGFSKKLKLRMAHVVCAEAYHARADAFAAWSRQDATTRLNADTREQREALRVSLAYCACGGKAGDHREDRDGNLLECSHCDDCGQFHYQTDSAEAA